MRGAKSADDEERWRNNSGLGCYDRLPGINLLHRASDVRSPRHRSRRHRLPNRYCSISKVPTSLSADLYRPHNLLLGISFYLAYRRSTPVCVSGNVGVPGAINRANRTLLWVLAVLALGLVVAPYWLGL